MASPLAHSAIVAKVVTVMAVPSAIAKVDATPTKNKPWAEAKTNTIKAPEQGRKPTDTIAAQAERKDNGSCMVLGSTA